MAAGRGEGKSVFFRIMVLKDYPFSRSWPYTHEYTVSTNGLNEFKRRKHGWEGVMVGGRGRTGGG